MRTTDTIVELELIEPTTTLTAAQAMRQAVTSLVVWARIWKNRRAANRLLELDERILADIGLSTADLHAVLGDRSRNQDPAMQLTMLARKRALRCLT